MSPYIEPWDTAATIRSCHAARPRPSPFKERAIAPTVPQAKKKMANTRIAQRKESTQLNFTRRGGWLSGRCTSGSRVTVAMWAGVKQRAGPLDQPSALV